MIYSKISISDIPKIGPKNSPKISQITVTIGETDSWPDSQNIPLDFVQILVVHVPKRELKMYFFGTLLKSN